MRRPHDGTHWIGRIWPLFSWVTCWKCHDEFRREWLWRMYGRWRGDLSTFRRPVEIRFCRQCAPTREDALRIFREIWPPKPPAPPKVAPGEDPAAAPKTEPSGSYVVLPAWPPIVESPKPVPNDESWSQG